MAGKNKVERSFRFWADDSGGTARDLSGDLIPGSLQGGGIVLDQVDMHGVSETVRNYLAGYGDAPIGGKFHVNNTATTGSFTVLNGNRGSSGTITLQWGEDGAAPTTGDIEFEGEYVYLGFPIQFEGGKATMTCNFMPSGSTAPAFGTVA